MADDGEEYGVPLLNRLKTGYSACVYQPLASLEGDCATGESDMAYWLMKSEPDEYGWDDLLRDGSTEWTGVRNHAAAKHLRAMKKDDRAFFYHSNAKPPGIVGLMEVVETGITDPSQFDPSNKYFDPKSKPEAPRWDCVRLRYVGRFAAMLSLDDLRQSFSEDELGVIKRGNRLSILPVIGASAERLLELLGPATP